MLSQKQIEKTIEQSPLVFVGIVKKTGASNLAALKATSQLNLVEIVSVANAPEAFIGITGTIVTVKTPARVKLKSGDSRLFFTKRLMYGENLAVEATVVDTVNKDHREITKAIQNAISGIERKEQLQRISGADLIVEGKVTKMEESEINKYFPGTFRAPDWVSVFINITRVIRGKYDSKIIEALISKGGEVEETTPLEVKIGMTGIWLLRQEMILKHVKIEKKFYVIEEPEDFLHSYEYQMLTNPKPY